MEPEEYRKEEGKNREKVLVPVRRQDSVHEEEISEEPSEEKVWKITQRWHIY